MDKNKRTVQRRGDDIVYEENNLYNTRAVVEDISYMSRVVVF